MNAGRPPRPSGQASPPRPTSAAGVERSLPRRALEEAASVATGVVPMAIHAAGGLLTGALAASKDRELYPTRESPHGYCAGAARIALCAAAGAVVGGLPGAWAGAVAGLSVLFPLAVSRTAQDIGQRVESAAVEATRGRGPRPDGARRTAWLAARGGLEGLAQGAREGHRLGEPVGRSLASGLVEGAKGVGAAVLGAYEAPAGPEASPRGGGPIRVALGTAAGLVGGLAGLAVEAVDGALQGIRLGLSDRTPPEPFKRFDETPGGKLHIATRSVMAIAAGAGAGLALGGPGAAFVGVLAGGVLGVLEMDLESATGADRAMLAGIQAAVEHAEADNEYSGPFGPAAKSGPEGLRDGVEGMLVGTAAGAREGFKAGYAGGRALVDGVLDGLEGAAFGT